MDSVNMKNQKLALNVKAFTKHSTAMYALQQFNPQRVLLIGFCQAVWPKPPFLPKMFETVQRQIQSATTPENPYWR
ncbi:hypothetical protein JTE90_017640 [Oedothorax gibbosus]|uniref:Uncharacterized protein n=1 Tax=Oedothorax gibbosus TaxID=931172 RepID=A0AAV6U7S5_9ARAC|nr:hypothetical protein JTE90_017640 [Oedothorax gibbosus]